MLIIGSTLEMKQWARRGLAQGKTIGLVPTMGFLHEGHISLMRMGRSQNDLLVAGIFVNPTQFGPTEDFAAYPRDTEADLVKCRAAGVDALFMPHAEDVYRNGFQTYVEVQQVSAPLCGASRPGHFRGVATVVLKFFNIVRPTRAYFGCKDYQQLQVIKTMVRDLDADVEVVPCPTVRETDGLAMSSRNAYLSPDHRKQAVCLFQALKSAEELFRNRATDPQEYLDVMSDRIRREPDALVDYISLVDPDTLQPLAEVTDRALAILAVRIGTTRLIDNMLFRR